MSDPRSFSTLPTTANDMNIRPFHPDTPTSTLFAMFVLVSSIPPPPQTYENIHPDGNDGLTHAFMRLALQRWTNPNLFSYPRLESRLSALPNFTTTIHMDRQLYTMHFLALFSQHQSPGPPVVLLRGVSSSVLEFLPLLEHITAKYTPNTLPFSIIVPSLPGYGYSGLPKSTPAGPATPFTKAHAAAVIDTLLTSPAHLNMKRYLISSPSPSTLPLDLDLARHSTCIGLHAALPAPTLPAPQSSRTTQPVHPSEDTPTQTKEGVDIPPGILTWLTAHPTGLLAYVAQFLLPSLPALCSTSSPAAAQALNNVKPASRSARVSHRREGAYKDRQGASGVFETEAGMSSAGDDLEQARREIQQWELLLGTVTLWYLTSTVAGSAWAREQATDESGTVGMLEVDHELERSRGAQGGKDEKLSSADDEGGSKADDVAGAIGEQRRSEGGSDGGGDKPLLVGLTVQRVEGDVAAGYAAWAARVQQWWERRGEVVYWAERQRSRSVLGGLAVWEDPKVWWEEMLGFVKGVSDVIGEGNGKDQKRMEWGSTDERGSFDGGKDNWPKEEAESSRDTEDEAQGRYLLD